MSGGGGDRAPPWTQEPLPVPYPALDRRFDGAVDHDRAGGRAYVHVDTAGQHLQIDDASGKPVSVLDYLARGRGLAITHTDPDTPVGRPEDPDMLRHTALVLTRTAGPIELPPLELVEVTASEPPLRRYRMVGA